MDNRIAFAIEMHLIGPVLRLDGRPSPSTGGFTLIELLTVIAIVALLTSTFLGVSHHARRTARIAQAKSELAAISASLNAYRRTYGEYPQVDRPALLLQSLIGRRGPDGVSISGRPLLEMARFTTNDSLNPSDHTDAVLLDPWSQPYEYRYTAGATGLPSAFVLYSCGPDGRGAELSGSYENGSASENRDNLYAGR